MSAARSVRRSWAGRPRSLPRPGHRPGRLRAVAAPALVLAGLLAVWELATVATGVEPAIVPAPSDVAGALWTDRALLAADTWVTAQEVVIGLAVAVIVGVSVAITLHLSAGARRALFPLVVGSQAIPIVAIAPILVLWFGFGLAPKLIVIGLICFFPLCVATIDGLRSVDPALVAMMRSLDADRLTILRRVEIPAALPHAFSGAKIAATIAVIGAVFGEWAGADSGLGQLILQANRQLLTARMFAAVVILALLAVGLFALVGACQRHFVHWSGRETARR
ncbi:MAG: ABC transporter permease [Solirubrobacterales bacterium]